LALHEKTWLESGLECNLSSTKLGKKRLSLNNTFYKIRKNNKFGLILDFLSEKIFLKFKNKYPKDSSPWLKTRIFPFSLENLQKTRILGLESEDSTHHYDWMTDWLLSGGYCGAAPSHPDAGGTVEVRSGGFMSTDICPFGNSDRFEPLVDHSGMDGIGDCNGEIRRTDEVEEETEDETVVVVRTYQGRDSPNINQDLIGARFTNFYQVRCSRHLV
jgi:hypothetical protein